MILLASANLLRWIVSGLLCGATVVCGVWFLLRQGGPARRRVLQEAPAELREGMRKRQRRRRYGAALVILVAATFFAALNVLDPQSGVDPNAAVAVWAVVLLMLVILVVLALADLRQTLTGRGLREMELSEQLVRALSKHLANKGKAAASADAEETHEQDAEEADRDAGGNGQDR